MKRNKLTIAICSIVMVLLGGSCSAPKNVAYFQDTETQTIVQLAAETPMVVRAGDKLSIVVKSKDPSISDLFNLPVYTSRIGASESANGDKVELRANTGRSGEGVANYTVDPKGNIDFPVLGSLHVEGMTRSELSGFIKGELMGRSLVKDPVVIVEFLSTGVDILGDVRNPGRYDVNKDKITLLEALSLAGDLNVTGQRENVKVIRKEGNTLHTYTLNLTNTAEMAKSPAYYLQQGDVVYVEPNAMQKRSTTVNGNNTLSFGFWISVASLLTSVVTTLAVFIRK